MGQILLVDPNEVARRAMQGILARGGHRLAVAGSAQEAMEIIHRNVRVDLVFTELQLPGEGGLAFVRHLKADRLLKLLPVVIYTEHPDREAVKCALELRVQNFLVKPYHDDDIFAEIDKAEVNPWRARHFEEEKSFCKMMGLQPAELHKMLGAVRDAIQVAIGPLKQAAEARDARETGQLLSPLRDQAETAGAWGVVECFNQINEHTVAGSWSALTHDIQLLSFGAELVSHWIDPERMCPDFQAQAKPSPNANAFARERVEWAGAPGTGRCPVIPWEQLLREVEGLAGCPVIDSAAAGLQMLANGHPSCINPVMDLVARDPGLTMQMLIAANRVHPPEDEFSRIEDARLAVGQLGEVHLQTEARKLVILDAATFALEPAFSWVGYWTFQRGVARIAQLICRDLEFNSLENAARVAGQLHDTGLMLVAKLHPGGFQAMLDHARTQRLPLREVEKLFLGGTTPQLAAHFAEKSGLSRRYANVFRWLNEPGAATEDKHLIAIISLARDLCRHNEVGTSGDPVVANPVPLEETPEWAILKEGLYPSFNMRQFELKVHSYCGQLRSEFSGHQAGTVGELVASGATA